MKNNVGSPGSLTDPTLLATEEDLQLVRHRPSPQTPNLTLVQSEYDELVGLEKAPFVELFRSVLRLPVVLLHFALSPPFGRWFSKRCHNAHDPFAIGLLRQPIAGPLSCLIDYIVHRSTLHPLHKSQSVEVRSPEADTHK